MTGVLDDAVERFIEGVTPAVLGLARRVPGSPVADLESDVALEALNLVSAFIDADGNHTDDELRALIGAFAGRMDTDLRHSTPSDLRRSGVVAGKRTWLESPSPLFVLLCEADARDRTVEAWHYYDNAMHLAHAVCALDIETGMKLGALDRFRSTLLEAMAGAGLTNPWTGQPIGAVSAAPAATAAPATAAPSVMAGEPAPVPPVPPVPPVEPAVPVAALLAELDGLVGLAAVKAEVHQVADLLAVQALRRKHGLRVAETSHHLVFTGNPGTGKTTVARLVAQIYRSLEVVKKGHLVETDRAGLVAGFVGQTAIRVAEVFTRASGGVLLIDEAYALVRGQAGDFGHEAVDTLVKLMEDRRDDVVVIAAGYPDEMGEFLNSNPGLRSRFPRTILFPDYTTDELVAIFDGMCRDSSYRCSMEAAATMRAFFDAQPRDKGFGNARLARNLFESAVARQASRVVRLTEPTDEQLCELLPADIG